MTDHPPSDDDATDDELGAPIRADGLRLVLIPAEVLLAVRDLTEGEGASDEVGRAGDDAVPWPDVGPISSELAARLPAALRLRQAEADPAVAAWLVRAIVLDDPDAPTGQRVAGHFGGHDRPDADGMVEVGYTVAAADRGRGLATQAARAWFAWAHRHGARTARLSITPDNGPSVAIAARLGLAATDRVWDDDDEVWEVVYEAPLPLHH